MITVWHLSVGKHVCPEKEASNEKKLMGKPQTSDNWTAQQG